MPKGFPRVKIRAKKTESSKGKNAKKEKAANKVAQPEADNSSSEESEIEDEEEGGTRIAGVYIPPAPPAVCSSESIGPRLIITHIANENFKSYAGRQVLGPFHKSFTGIIGPNGSGKSNVIDSMLFVFGYRATKIRSKKISVLLHNSENHQNIRSATVEVHFVQIIDKPGDDFEVVPNTAFYVSRTAFHDNTSHYCINGKRVQFKEVAQLLGKHGIDLKHNRFLILQGEVEQIAMMKPKAPNDHESGMLEYLEDLIGTSRYKKPIEKLDAKVNVLNEERQEKLNRTKLAEKDKEALQEPMQEAVKYLRYVNIRTSLKNKYYQRQIYDLDKDLNQLLQEKAEMDKETEERREKMKTAQEQITEKEKILTAKRKEFDSMKSQKEKLVDSFNKVEKRATQLKEEISQTNKKRKKALDSKKQEENKLAELEKVPEKNEKEIQELTTHQEKLKKNRELEEIEVQKVLDSLKVETEGLQEQKDAINNTLIGLKKKTEDARSKYELAKTELSVYLSNEKKEKEKLQKLKSSLDNVLSQLEEKRKMLRELETSAPEAEQSLAAKQSELNNLRNEEFRVTQELNQQRSVMEEKKHSMSASVSRNQVINYLMQLKEKGELPGIFGRLGDLGGIDAKYDCAVSTACGPLDYIVVDTSTTAKHCVNALKRSNLGRGNFIALDQQNKFIPNCNQRFMGPENVPRLFDLIRVEDERVKPAFYFGLRDTLVAKDLAQARRVAYGATRYRVVTLNGEIIEIAGTMSGGGRDKRTGRMGRSATVKTDVSSPGTMRKLEERVYQLQERAANIHKRMNDLEQEMVTLTQRARKFRMDLNHTQMEVKNLNQQEPSLRSQVTNQESVVANTVSDPEVVQQKTELVESLKTEFDQAAAESGKLEKQVADITSKINAITGGRMQAAEQKLEKVSKQLDKVTTEITKLTVGIKTSERNCKKSRERIQALTVEISEAEEHLLKAQEENKGLDEEAVKVNGFIQSISEKIMEVESTLTAVKSEVSQLNKDVSELKASLLNEKQRMDKTQKDIAETKDSLKIIKNKLSALKLEVIPDEEAEDIELPVFTEEEMKEFSLTQLDYAILEKEEMINKMSPNLKTIDEYREKADFFKARLAELEDVTQRRNEARKGQEEVKKAQLIEFMKGFAIISHKLKEMYQMITFGGDAELELIDSLDPFSEGIGFSVRPPKKSWKHISNLSGGERTLSSLALVFALHYYKPSPLYVMDEIDAALDFKNVSIVGHYIKQRTRNSQFIIISLRSNMFELSDVLVGIYKTYNCTKSVTITPAKYAPEEEPPSGNENNNKKRDHTKNNHKNTEASNRESAKQRNDQVRTSKTNKNSEAQKKDIRVSKNQEVETQKAQAEAPRDHSEEPKTNGRNKHSYDTDTDDGPPQKKQK